MASIVKTARKHCIWDLASVTAQICVQYQDEPWGGQWICNSYKLVVQVMAVNQPIPEGGARGFTSPKFLGNQSITNIFTTRGYGRQCVVKTMHSLPRNNTDQNLKQ